MTDRGSRARWMLGLPLAASLSLVTAAAPPRAARPPITGIAHVAFYTTHPAAAARFWTDVIGARQEDDPAISGARRFFVNGAQFVELIPAATRPPQGMLAHVAYVTTDIAAMRRYLVATTGKEVSEIARLPDGSRSIRVTDPEGVEVRFVQRAPETGQAVRRAVGSRIIHTGHVVHDRSREDGFYRHVLAFRPYWFGGMREGTTDWVSQQVPDGRDWLEYMLLQPGARAPDARTLGILNHVSLGVPDVRAAMRRLAAEKRPVAPDVKPQLGRDGKWQANLYDPDGTRVELMDFTARGRPCCSPFTAPDPQP